MNRQPLVSIFSRRTISAALITVLFGLPAIALAAGAPERSGKEVFEAVCVTCHGPGKDGAPRMGNAAEWSPRAAQGLNSITRNAITGVGKMPGHGGQGALTDLEISRAVSYMVSGGAATDPNKAYSSPQQITGEELVKTHCQNCHASGMDGAPRIGNLTDWAPRLNKGLDVLVQSSIRGHKAMPARSGMNNLSDADMKAAVSYMANQATANSLK
ncbi:c-type cytochrome [Propionivibrio sp.]|uniref:c-type cytochrome n=1 Tax=Propionivibrio sp. TaxID=2212460 RepID=UPI003BF0DCA9